MQSFRCFVSYAISGKMHPNLTWLLAPNEFATQWVKPPYLNLLDPVFSPSSPFSPDTFLYAGHSSVSSAPVEDSWAVNYESLVGWLVWVWELTPPKKQKNELEAIVLQFFLCLLLFGMFLLNLLTFPEAALFSLTLNLVHSLINQFM